MNHPKFFESIYQSEQNALEAADLKGRIVGTQLGIVTVNDDPDGKRRVKCKFAHNPQLDSYWLLRSNPSSGVDVPVPKLGDTVTVNFIQGNPNHGLYQVLENDINPPHKTDDELLDYSQKVEGGVFIESEKKIELKAGEKITITSNDIAILTINPDGTIELKGLSINVLGLTTIALETPQLFLNAGNITCKPGANINFKDSGTVKFENCDRVTFDNVNQVDFNNPSSAKINGKEIAVVGAFVSGNNGGGNIVSKGW